MSDIINLKHARKVKARAEKSAQADQNRRKYGQTKAEKLKAAKKADQARKHLDGHKVDRPDSDQSD